MKTILRFPLSSGQVGTDETIAVMRAVAIDAAESGRLTAATARRIRDDNQSAWMRMKDVYAFLHASVIYADDAEGVEQIRTPERMLLDMQNAKDGKARGDCDDRATLGAALLLAMGLPAYFIVVTSSPLRQWHHVFYGSALPDVPDRVIPFDPQENIPPGIWPAHHDRKAYPVRR
jgi:transglutaminase-like putative cysteine protease